jgi:hypothetical protein
MRGLCEVGFEGKRENEDFNLLEKVEPDKKE